MKNIMLTTSSLLGRVCDIAGWLGAILFLLIALLMVGQSVGRAFGIAMVGGDEITGWMNASAGFVALSYTFRQGGLIRMEMLLDKVRPEQRAIVELVALSVGTLWCSYMAAAMSYFVYQNFVAHERSTGLISIPMWPIQIPTCFGMLLLALVFLEQWIKVYSGLEPDYVVVAKQNRVNDEVSSEGV